MAKHNEVTLVWVPAHKGILGNELANKLPGNGSVTIFIGWELGLAITKTGIGGTVAQWITKAQ